MESMEFINKYNTPGNEMNPRIEINRDSRITSTKWGFVFKEFDFLSNLRVDNGSLNLTFLKTKRYSKKRYHAIWTYFCLRIRVISNSAVLTVAFCKMKSSCRKH